MGEAKRRKMSGYVKPQTERRKPKRKIAVVGGSPFAAIAALLSQYPRLPR